MHPLFYRHTHIGDDVKVMSLPTDTNNTIRASFHLQKTIFTNNEQEPVQGHSDILLIYKITLKYILLYLVGSWHHWCVLMV